MAIYQKARFVSENIAKARWGPVPLDGLWVLGGRPPIAKTDKFITPSGVVMDKEDRESRSYQTNMKVMVSPSKIFWAWANHQIIELQPEFLDTEKEELPVYVMDLEEIRKNQESG